MGTNLSAPDFAFFKSTGDCPPLTVELKLLHYCTVCSTNAPPEARWARVKESKNVCMSTIFQPPPSNLTTIASIMTSEIQTGKASIQWMSPEHEKSLLSNFLLLSFCLPAAASVNLTFGLFYLSHQHRWPAPDRKLSPSNGKETIIFLALTNQSCQNTVSWTSWNRVHTLWKWRKFECSFAVYNLPPYCAIPFWGDLENLRMQSAHLSPGIEILTSLNFESQLQIVYNHLTFCP